MVTGRVLLYNWELTCPVRYMINETHLHASVSLWGWNVLKSLGLASFGESSKLRKKIPLCSRIQSPQNRIISEFKNTNVINVWCDREKTGFAKNLHPLVGSQCKRLFGSCETFSSTFYSQAFKPSSDAQLLLRRTYSNSFDGRKLALPVPYNIERFVGFPMEPEYPNVTVNSFLPNGHDHLDPRELVSFLRSNVIQNKNSEAVIPTISLHLRMGKINDFRHHMREYEVDATLKCLVRCFSRRIELYLRNTRNENQTRIHGILLLATDKPERIQEVKNYLRSYFGNKIVVITSKKTVHTHDSLVCLPEDADGYAKLMADIMLMCRGAEFMGTYWSSLSWLIGQYCGYFCSNKFRALYPGLWYHHNRDQDELQDDELTEAQNKSISCEDLWEEREKKRKGENKKRA
eukprot:gb/GECH01001010.1/.p1 GENE.gb/GECH01001010.1/~~gb/GECH01001010.1/.p1  ORF type:complete len:404 (+),score=46.02 gb/GECH01001010.1/:1-1212(+)